MYSFAFYLKDRWRDSQKGIFYLSVHTPDAHNNRGLVRMKQEPKTILLSHMSDRGLSYQCCPPWVHINSKLAEKWSC